MLLNKFIHDFISKLKCFKMKKSNFEKFWKENVNDTIQNFKDHDFEKSII